MFIVNAISNVKGIINTIIISIAIIINIILLLLSKVLLHLNLAQSVNGLVSNHTSFGRPRFSSNSSYGFSS